jgi:hypothetical protein
MPELSRARSHPRRRLPFGAFVRYSDDALEAFVVDGGDRRSRQQALPGVSGFSGTGYPAFQGTRRRDYRTQLVDTAGRGVRCAPDPLRGASRTSRRPVESSPSCLEARPDPSFCVPRDSVFWSLSVDTDREFGAQPGPPFCRSLQAGEVDGPHRPSTRSMASRGPNIDVRRSRIHRSLSRGTSFTLPPRPSVAAP